MTEHQGLPVHGYQPQSDDKVALVNRFKEMEERLLRELDALKPVDVHGNGLSPHAVERLSPYDQRWTAIARTHFQEGFMALNRAVFQPARIKLPEDGE